MAKLRRRRCRILGGALAVVAMTAAGVATGLGSRALGAGPQAHADSIYADSTGDAGQAPDIARVVVSHTPSGQISFHVDLVGMATLPADVTVFIGVDVDSNRATGAPANLGADYVVAAQGSDHSIWTEHWNGSGFDPWRPATTGLFRDGDGVTISIDNSSLSGTTAFNFWLSTQLGTGGAGKVDFAPNAGTWTYRFAGPPPATTTPATGTGSTFVDPAGDSARGPDITRVAVSNDASGTISFQVAVANRTAFVPDDDAVQLCFDTDRNPSTGLQNPRQCPPGAEYVLYLVYPSGSIFVRWNGTRLESAPRNTLTVSGSNPLTISINRSELGNTSGFNFQLSTEPVPGDTAPDAGTWTYVLTTPKPPPTTTRTTTAPKPSKPKPARTIRSMKLQSRPAVPTAGSSFTVLVPSIVWSTGKTEKPDSVTCKARLAGAALKGAAAGGCTFAIPRSAGGKQLAVTVTARCHAKVKSKAVAYTVRAAAKAVAPKPKPKPKPTVTTTTTATTTPASQTISTPAGRLAIAGVDLLDRFPAGCSSSSFDCDVAKPGYKILVVWLRPLGGDPFAFVGELADTYEKVTVQAGDGSTTKAYSAGVRSGSLFVAFTPKASSSGFRLSWPGNSPIALGK